MDLSEHLADVAESFDSWARARRDEGMARRHRLTAEPVLDDLGLGPGQRLLDLGTGNGWAVRIARDLGASGIGVDAAPEMLVRARDHGVPVVRAAFGALPFHDAAFDQVFSMEAIYYATDVPRTLAEIRRVLVPGGEHHAVLDYYEGNEASRDWPRVTGVEMTRLSEDGWADAFEAAGFVDVATERIRLPKDRIPDADHAWMTQVGSLHVEGRRPGPQTP